MCQPRPSTPKRTARGAALSFPVEWAKQSTMRLGVPENLTGLTHHGYPSKKCR